MSDIAAQISSKISQLTSEFDLITNNLANVSTVGYKRRINDFSRLMDSKLNADKYENQDGEPKSPVVYDFSQGSLNQTGSKLDLALCGKGFFTIETPDGVVYTRNGMFHLDADGKIVDSQGRILAGQSGPITVPSTVSLSQINVSADGNITAEGLPIGKMKLADFGEDENKLIAVGNNCFKMTDRRIKAQNPEDTIIKQGFLEGSNVQMVEELVDMIMVSRMYQSNMQFVDVKKDSSQSLMNVAMA